MSKKSDRRAEKEEKLWRKKRKNRFLHFSKILFKNCCSEEVITEFMMRRVNDKSLYQRKVFW